MKKVLLLLLVLSTLIVMVSCSTDNINSSDETTYYENNSQNDTEILEENPENIINENNFSMLNVSVDDAEEGYNILVEGDEKINDQIGYFNKKNVDGIIVEKLNTSADYGSSYDANYSLIQGLSKDILINIMPSEPLPEVKYAELDYDTSFFYIRRFTINYFDSILSAGSNQFEKITFNHQNEINIFKHKGNFSFLIYPFDDFNGEGIFMGDYYQVFVYATTENLSDINFMFDKETQIFKLSSTQDISKIYIKVTKKDNDSVETICQENIKGKNIEFTINEDFTANIIEK